MTIHEIKSVGFSNLVWKCREKTTCSAPRLLIRKLLNTETRIHEKSVESTANPFGMRDRLQKFLGWGIPVYFPAEYVTLPELRDFFMASNLSG